jgi:HAE1 family hydrophobic/amphiphilic exporter-1
MRREGWYRRPVTVTSVLFALIALALSFLPRMELGQGQTGGRVSWDVIIEHFGVDSDEVERSITRPLETEFGRLDGVSALKSVSEYGKSRVTVEVAEGTDLGAFFLALSDAVDRVYTDLPSSVQKPRIVSSSGSQAPAFIAALEGPHRSLDDLRDWVEREVKPSLEKRAGVGEVEVGGGAVKEVHVVVDEGRAATLGLSFDALAQAVQTQDALLPAGVLTENGVDHGVSVRGRLQNLDAIGFARIGLASGTSVRLDTLARVTYAGREADTTSRLDGQERVVLMVHAAGTANLVAFSREMALVMADLRAQGIDSQVILDEGKGLEEALWDTIRALLEGLAAVLLTLPLLLPWSRRIGAIALILPLALLVTTALLAALGLTIDRFVLAGFAVGLGTVLDFAILICRTDPEGLGEVLASLGTALVTTLLFLAPLAFLDFVWPGIRTLVIAVGLLLLVSFVLSALFLPVLRGASTRPPVRFLTTIRGWIGGRWARPARRLVGGLVIQSTRHPRVVLVASLVLAVGAFASVVLVGVNVGAPSSTRELSAHVEFESEASLASVDARSAELVRLIRQLPGVTRVQSLARPGSSELTVGWDGTSITRGTLADSLVEAGRGIQGAFVYLPGGVDPRTTSVQLTLSGDDNDRLRSLAKLAARSLGQSEGVTQVVLNFKDPPRRLAVRFDPAKTTRSGMSAAEVASALRWNLWGPVAVKWIDDGRERDLRILGAKSRSLDRDSLMDLPLVGTHGTVKVSNLARLVEETGGANFYHENRQRVVYLAVQTTLASARRISEVIGGALGRLDWPTGYTYRIDPRLAEQESHFSLVGAALALSLILIAILLAARSQSLGVSPLTLAMVPVALAFPIVGASLAGGFTIPVLLGLVLLGGTVVNNAILIVDSARSRPGALVYGAIRRRLVPLVMTNVTAVLGALPLALAGHSGGLLPTLALLVLWGALGATLTTMTTIPALLRLFPRALRPLNVNVAPSPRAESTPEVHR